MAKLTARQAATAKPGRHSDGDGLLLDVSKTGKRSWFLRYQLKGRRRDMKLGSLDDLPLAQARERAGALRALVRRGIDPLEQRLQAEPPSPAIPTFSTLAAQYIRQHRRGWSNPRHARTWVRSLRTYCKPVFGARPADQIGADEVLQALRPIWHSKTETASRIQQRLERIFDLAVSRGYRPDNPARWRGGLQNELPPASKTKRVARGGTEPHYEAMPYQEVPAFFAELDRSEGISARALQFLILCAGRTSEVLQAQWSEFHLADAVWIVPASRMKARREHRVPLTQAMLAVLDRLPRIDKWVFPGARSSRPLSNTSMIVLMRKHGHGLGAEKSGAVPHGFRSSFRIWAAEQSSAPREVAEQALAHTNTNRIEATYQRSDLFDRRRALMRSWADWCTRPPSAVVDLDARRAKTG